MTRFVADLEAAVRPREAAVLDEDGVAEHLLRTSRWERAARGLYVPAGVSRTAGQRIVSAAALLPPDGVVGGWAAGHVHGVDLLDGLDHHREELDVDVLLPPGLHRLDVPGVAYRRASLGPGETTTVQGLRVTSPLRTALDLACWAPSLTEATVRLDPACRPAWNVRRSWRGHRGDDEVRCRPETRSPCREPGPAVRGRRA